MLRRDLIKNKIYGIVFIVLGALTIPIDWDATFFLFALMVGQLRTTEKMQRVTMIRQLTMRLRMWSRNRTRMT